MKLYGEISKTEELDDGTIKVWGYASSQAVDADGETITSEAMKAALPDYMKFGAVREMHQAKAAGTAIEAKVEDDGRTFFGAHIVDSEAVKKVKASVYKGFSIGGKVTGRDDLNKTIITGLKLVEVSLVDRPANPEAVFTMFKSETLDSEPSPDQVSAVDQLAEMLNKGEITPERLVELAKTSNEPPQQDEPADGGKTEEVQKSMWNVQDFAAALQGLGYICASAEWDKQSEGDNSPVPAQLRAWLEQGVEIFKAMAAEELAEMLADLKEQAGEIEIVQLAAKGGDISKAGAKFATSTKEALGDIHKGMLALCDKMDGLGYKDADGDTDKAATGDDLKKVAGELDLAKAEINKLSDSLAKSQARVTELEAMPAPGKALLKAISKGEDIDPAATARQEVDPVKKADGTVDDAATLIKGIHKTGGRMLVV